MALAATKPAYKAVFERTTKRKVDGQESVVTDQITDPADPALATLIRDGFDGYLRVTDGETGAKILGMHMSAIKAKETLTAIAKGTYNPFPKVKNKKKELQ